MSDVSPREVLARVSAAIPAACRDNIVIVGSLAAGYHLLGDRAEAQVRTKDVDCLLYPRVEAVRAGGEVAGQLLDAGWHPKAEGKHAQPGTESTPEDSLPAVRLYPPASQEWFLELLAAHERGDAADKRWMRLRLPAGHFGLPSYRFLDLAIHQAPMTDLGLRCARPEMLALSNLLRNPEIRPDTMDALVEGRTIKRSNKDLGRVVAIARLSDPDAPRDWRGSWSEALQALHADSWRHLAGRVGSGLQAVLASEPDLDEACLTCNVGLLASAPITPRQFRVVAERVLVDAAEPLAAASTD